jgi:hypothetical protein
MKRTFCPPAHITLIAYCFLLLIMVIPFKGRSETGTDPSNPNNSGFIFDLSRPHYNNLAFPDSTENKDTASKFDTFNQKMERLFKIIPVPLYSYSSEAGNIFGLAKFNLFHLSKSDTISKPSKISGVFTVSSKGRVNFSVSTELVFKQNKYVVLSYLNYKKTPEYILGIGNEVSLDSVEEVTTNRFKFVATGLVMVAPDLYAGGGLDLANYFDIATEDSSFLIRDNVNGLNGGTNVGIGIAGAWDKRDNRYNPLHGAYVLTTLMWYPSWLGSKYEYNKFTLDARKYFNPWLKHVIAIQATTTYANRDVPFYELSMMGGDSQMRGYYLGALRDNVLVDGQIEYRMPVWSIFGITTWAGTGRVANTYNDIALDGFWLSYGAGLRIRVDTKNNTNLRVDFGFGPNGVTGTYINFAEAF